MTSRLNKCSENEIKTILDTESNSSREGESCDNINEITLRKKKSSKVQNIVEHIVDASSDTENVFQSYKNTLQKINNLHKEKSSLRIKLRRSTEQSLYKIDTDSEYEKAIHKSHKRFYRQKKKSYSEMESEGSCSDSKDNFTTGKLNNSKKLVEKQIENGLETERLERGSRNRKPPLRLSFYHCDTLNFSESTPINSPSLRSRKNINYNEDKLLVNSIIYNLKNKKQSEKQPHNKASNNSDSKHDLGVNPRHLNINNNKRNRIPSTRDGENGSYTDIIFKVKSLKKSNKSKSRHKLDHSSKIQEITQKQDSLISAPINNTPVKLNKQKRTNCGNTQKNIRYVNDNNRNSEDDCLVDIYKRIKISSPIKNFTPTRLNKQKKVISENTETGVQFDNKRSSSTGDEYLSDTYKSVKVSSTRKIPQIKHSVEKSIESHLEETHLSTPKSHKIKVKHSNLTPSLVKRNNVPLKPTTPLQEAKSRLHVSAVPKSLPCREEEFNNIFTFLRGKLEDKNGGCIYISGVPGTGKTATVNEVIRCLQKLIIKGQLDDFNYVAINGMKLTEPRQAYVQILKQLDGKTATWEQSYHILEKRFHSTTSKMTLLLIDELDFLCTKRQDVVYNLLDWPTKSTAQLVVITIANTMDLPERVLMGRVTSRLGLTRLTFQPYNYKQLQEIVMSRLKDFYGFRNEAIQLVARKVSAVSGDARRALDICRRAVEIAESQSAETISLQDVTEAVSEMIASAKVQAIKHCSKMEQIFLQAMSAEVTRTSIEEVYFKDAYKQLESLCSFDGIEVPSVTEILAICGRLGANRLLICEHSKNDIYQKILLNVSTDDIHYAIKELNLN
ncbi:Origin recognition complex subunit 1 [Eufriesea mexicana]|uniref:Origin recognition complex subunit 1 n=1 Tax=Eufriesea mexicana TaxID=516756 RepID=A0A310SAG7_9HYME|nr:PREDICTED: origin recognition complex subunit 1 [Eufriesea mexicana]OAD52051.1 Origin recognition complex subunit 1 [Eufriesea mexicana]